MLLKFNRHAKSKVSSSIIDLIPLVNVLFLVVSFYVLSTAFTLSPDIHVSLPKTVTSDALQEESSVITITGENVIYWRSNIVSIKDLQTQMSRLSKNRSPILIKADRRASVGRIIDVWDLCRAMGIERINIAATRE